MKKLFLLAGLLSVCAVLTGCASVNDEDGAYLRVSNGEYGAKLLQWVGLGVTGEYCQVSTNEVDYVWTTEDLAFFKEQCPAQTDRIRIIEQLLSEQ